MSLHQVKVARKEVLDIVKENKKKHDAILTDAIEGFWTDAEKMLKKTEKEAILAWERNHKDQLKKMRKDLRDQKRNLREQIKKELALVSCRKKDGPFIYMKNKYPETHADDYIGTIRRLELCVEDQVELDTQEFDRYVRNKWEWRDSFLTSNTGYVTSYYNSGMSGSCVNKLGLYGEGRYGYEVANYAVSSSYALSASWSPGTCFGTGSCYSVLDNF
jgi:hypothetical protein